VPSGISHGKKEEVTGVCQKLHNEKLNSLYTSCIIIIIIIIIIIYLAYYFQRCFTNITEVLIK
jgi:sugar phosphate permease